jgi:hypothetical protein
MSGPAERGPDFNSVCPGGTRSGMVELNGTEGLVEDDPIDGSQESKQYDL